MFLLKQINCSLLQTCCLFPLGIHTNVAFNSISLRDEPFFLGGAALLVDMKPPIVLSPRHQNFLIKN